ncbi:D-alanine--D-alanine ligase [Salinispirillum sp. LH 10-3-1]|uniref:D-alanine--D-alanine ligase n=1 Tax=Salinispirillum sp. LH 10-3-1 TaxID=2952525 RepID=A0AB38YIS2_9GAMM
MTKVNTQGHQAGKVAVLFGGKSAERAVSLQSGQAVIDALRSSGADVLAIDTAEPFFDLLTSENVSQVFIALHGRGGEDGSIQGFLDTLGIPYTGSGVAASALAMNKVMTKQIWQGHGLPTARYELLDEDSHWADVLQQLGGKVVIKPVLEGSSIGITIADSPEQVKAGFTLARQFDRVVMAEQFIDGPEYTMSILDTADGLQALPVIRMKSAGQFYDYDAKYERDDTHYYLPSGLSDADEQAIQDLALQAFRVLGCANWGRIDAMRDADGSWYLLEANTVPGLTSHSLVPMAAKAAGLDFPALVHTILARHGG